MPKILSTIRSSRMVLVAVIMMAGLTVVILARVGWAQQKFGPDDIKSVPKSFLEGGDRTSALLEQILLVLKQEQQDDRALLDTVKGIDQKLDVLIKKMDTAR